MNVATPFSVPDSSGPLAHFPWPKTFAEIAIEIDGGHVCPLARVDLPLVASVSQLVLRQRVRGRRLPRSGVDRADGAARDVSIPERLDVEVKILDGAEPVGRRLESGGRSYTIAGVAQNSINEAFGEPPMPMIYLSYRDRPLPREKIVSAAYTPAPVTTAADVETNAPEFVHHYLGRPTVPMDQVLRPDAASKGRADAPITIVEFSDFQCPACGHAFRDLHDLVARRSEDRDLRAPLAIIGVGIVHFERYAGIPAVTVHRTIERQLNGSALDAE